MADSAALELEQRQSEGEEEGEQQQQVQADPAPGQESPVDAQEEPRDEDNELSQFLASKWEEIEEAALELFRKLLQTDTQNFKDDGTEIEAVMIIKEKFEEAGISYEIIEPKAGRGNIIARVVGNGSAGKGAILLSSHLDTVRAPKENWQEEGWKHDPYGAEIDEEDGCMYGRGAVDMKHMAAMSVTLLCFIKKNRIQLSRDLIFVGVADEERTDSTYGAKYLVENHPDLIEADIVFNKVGGFSMFFEGKEVFPIQIGEKGSAQIKITARGEGGHGSLLHKENPVAKVGAIAQKLANTQLPLRVVDGNRITIDNIASILPFPKSTVFRRLLSPTLSGIIIGRLLTEEQAATMVPLLHNMANPTVIGGGDQFNQIPTSAWLIVDGRILPGCTADDVVQDIQQVIGAGNFQPKQGPDNVELPPDLTIEVLAVRNPHFQDPGETSCQEVLEVIQEVIATRANGASIIKTMIPGATDSYYYAQNPRKKPVCLGFTPLRIPEDLKFAKLFHGTNERIPVDGFKWGLQVITEVVCKLCSAKLSSKV